MWFGEGKSGGSPLIGKITTTGVLTEYLLGLPSVHFVGYDVIAAADGNIWFTDQNQPLIGRITPTGVVSMFSIDLGSTPIIYLTNGPDGNM